MGLVISDSSTLIHLAAIGRLGLLKKITGVLRFPRRCGEKLSNREDREPVQWRLNKHVKLDG